MVRVPRSRLWPAYVVAASAAGALAALAIAGILRRAGEPALPLDDAFIHLQYARRLSEGHFFSYTPGQGYSSGATSLLWPVALAPAFWLGAGHGGAVVATWLLGAALHTATIVETGRLAHGLGGRAAGLGAAAMAAVFGGFVWFSYSGMESMGLAFILMHGARAAADLGERRRPSRRRLVGLAVAGLAGPLIRPEGALVSLLAAAALAAVAWRARPGGRWRAALLALVPLAGPLIIPALHRLFAGHAASSTAMVKWLPLDPYLDCAAVLEAVHANVTLLLTDLLDGGAWTRIFLPEGFVWALAFGAFGVAWLGHRTGRRQRAAIIVALVLATLGPATYATLLWNRVRYIWPFAGGWFVAVACGAVALGQWLERARPLLGLVTPVALGAMVAVLATKLPWTLQDLAQSARAIHLQQVSLGRWARAALPPGSRIGVNDTGAIAFASGHPTFDVVGLTTEGEAPHWAAGAGSRFEHYERLGAEALPTHFIVYPGWMANEPMLGRQLHQATVWEQSILGGRTMVAYEARTDLLNSGDRPLDPPPGALVDELDVADLVSEAAHDYALGGWARAADNVSVLNRGLDGTERADGGRHRRYEDRFSVSVASASTMVMRVLGGMVLEVWVDGERVASAPPAPWTGVVEWHERRVDLPASAGSGRRHIVVRPADGVPFTSFHYWWYERS